MIKTSISPLRRAALALLLISGFATALVGTVVAQGGGLDADGAHAFVNDLIRNHRYLRDVY